MPTCNHCQAELNAKVRTCPHCDTAYPTGRPIYAFPSIIVSCVVSSVICWVYLKMLGGFAWWQAAIITVPAVLLLFTVTIQLASWWDHHDPRR
jgi:hypothetical protein